MPPAFVVADSDPDTSTAEVSMYPVDVANVSVSIAPLASTKPARVFAETSPAVTSRRMAPASDSALTSANWPLTSVKPHRVVTSRSSSRA